MGVRPTAGVLVMTLLLYLHHWTHPVQRSHISLCQELKTLNMILLATNQIRVTIGLLVNSI